MQTTTRPLTSIKPYPGNPRTIPEAAVRKVAASLKEFGWRQPLVVDRDGVLIVGHTRMLAAQLNGWTEAPVHVAEDLTPEQVAAYRIADNRLGEETSWDDGALRAEISRMATAAIEATGFSSSEIDSLLSKARADVAAMLAADDQAEVDETADAITAPGDIWQLGRHRLLCGDCTDISSVAGLIGEARIDLLLTDPPYNVAYVGKTQDALTIDNDAMIDPKYQRFLESAIQPALDRMRPGASFYIWHADVHGYAVRGACSSLGMLVRQCLIWVKQTMVLGRQDYQWRHEPCLYGWKDGAPHTWLGGRKQTTVLEFDRPSRSGEHPTMKPVELFARIIESSCLPDGLVFDPFMGSGTTILAAEQLGRSAMGVDISPHYCDTVIRRWQSASGGGAVLIRAGKTFAEIAAQRGLTPATPAPPAPAKRRGKRKADSDV